MINSEFSDCPLLTDFMAEDHYLRPAPICVLGLYVKFVLGSRESTISRETRRRHQSIRTISKENWADDVSSRLSSFKCKKRLILVCSSFSPDAQKFKSVFEEAKEHASNSTDHTNKGGKYQCISWLAQ